MTPRLRAESEGVMVTLEGIRRLGSETLASCFGSPMSKNSVLDRLSESKLADIQVETVSIVVNSKGTCHRGIINEEMFANNNLHSEIIKLTGIIDKQQERISNKCPQYCHYYRTLAMYSTAHSIEVRPVHLLTQ